MIEQAEVIVLGAGLAGLAAASRIGTRAIVLERELRPGGLVRTEHFGEYWFDHVIHLLYFPDKRTEEEIRRLMGDELKPCSPVAWVESGAGTVLFPFQMHLGDLPEDVIVRCLRDLAETTFGPAPSSPPANFLELLHRSFGRGICEEFLLPYNRKMWKRPLETLAPGGFTWNITRPDFEAVMQGVISPRRSFAAYNSQGWYPRPDPDSPGRGMQRLSEALAGEIADLRLGYTVESIDLDARVVTARHSNRLHQFGYKKCCLSSLPLPKIVAACPQAPSDLVRACLGLPYNRVISVTLSIRGPRPTNCGHWRYYSDESLVFTRLVYMHEFDPLLAPPTGWGLLVEITELSEQPISSCESVFNRVRRDLNAVRALPDGCEIIDEHRIIIDPAYVVFTNESRAVVEEAKKFLKENSVYPVGRYGQWEYSSMGQVMRDSFEVARRLVPTPDESLMPESGCCGEREYV